MSDDEILDRIDELVDDQLAGYDQRSGYDFNVNQDVCGNCGRDWHGMPITWAIEYMRIWDDDGQILANYSHAKDESPVICVGPDQHGPNPVRPLNPEIRRWHLTGRFDGYRERLNEIASRCSARREDALRLKQRVSRHFGCPHLDLTPQLVVTDYLSATELSATERVGLDPGCGWSAIYRDPVMSPSDTCPTGFYGADVDDRQKAQAWAWARTWLAATVVVPQFPELSPATRGLFPELSPATRGLSQQTRASWSELAGELVQEELGWRTIGYVAEPFPYSSWIRESRNGPGYGYHNTLGAL